MHYLISYEAARPSSDRLQNELARRRANRLHGGTWLLQADIAVAELLLQLAMFVEEADSLVIADVTGRDIVVADRPDRMLSADVETPTNRSLAGASLAAEDSDDDAAEFPLAADPGESTS